MKHDEDIQKPFGHEKMCPGFGQSPAHSWPADWAQEERWFDTTDDLEGGPFYSNMIWYSLTV